MQKKILLITGSDSTKQFLYKQLREFIPDSCVIEAQSGEAGISPVLSCDLLIVSSSVMKKELDGLHTVYDCPDIIVCERNMNFDFIDQVANIPVNERVLLVNDDKASAESSIQDLISMGLNHISYAPYYPGIQGYERLETAITPGEADKVPSCVTRIIDMGPRIIDINSLYNIMEKLKLPHKDTTFITQKYMQKIIHVSKRISAINNSVSALNGYLNNIVDSLLNGILVYDEEGYIKHANEEMKKIFSTEKKLEGKNLRNIIDKALQPFFLSVDVFENKALEILGTPVRMTKFKVPDSRNIVVTVDRTKGDAQKKSYSQDILLKGHVARHNFEDIIGDSELLEDTKKIALKLSKSDLTVLIEGESGTGKELFASAIHNNSKRKFGPFLAINFSALPDELIESELFGYEEGAFTGAKKGGKIGLFELADGGTIFLDEIGDISPKVQTKLLRMLQEKEVMPLGGISIRKVDVRIIAATNQNLKQMVVEKQFRGDLYYRLKIGYIYLPPLRKRLCDLHSLVEYFISLETVAPVKAAPEVLMEFKRYSWLGNVRELESTVKYMLAVRTGDLLTLEDLPDKNFFEEDMAVLPGGHRKIPGALSLGEDCYLILKQIEYLQGLRITAGREKIAQNMKAEGLAMTQSQVRTRLDELEREGYVIKRRGKNGTVLTEKGRRQLEGRSQ
jgi:transcriptional regulator with PAS, ATPase and Fis domain